MNFANGLVQAYDRKWSFINSFKVEFHFDAAEGEYLPLSSLWEGVDQDKLQLNIISVNTPQFTNTPIEIFNGNRWRIHNGRDELYRFTMTFRDSNQLELYRRWVTSYEMTRLGYFDQVKFTVILSKDADYFGEEDKKLYEYNNVMIESVSQIDFNNTTENQVAEFQVGFKLLTPQIQY
jgi:hypothetical protein